MFSNNATLNTVIDQVEWIERLIGDLIISVKDHMNKLAAQGEKTFGSFENRFSKGNENFNAVANAAYQKCESLPSLITIIVFLVVAGIVVIASLLFLVAKCIHKIVYHRYIKIQQSKVNRQKMIYK
ncbi:unnamed protein product [Onchocerca flexuosa]|uniref:V-SNARE coiled-coil homology domain-containing protein n=1 Tax=Onchocerca flexuosa TaxID=387005 RepID=A0A183HG73_9BILA|nr:unnamed protein product [Onchocerca flexuosa]